MRIWTMAMEFETRGAHRRQHPERRSVRRFSFGKPHIGFFWNLIVLVAASTCVVSAARIYLSPDTARNPPWDGNCNNPCTPEPCSLPPPRSLTLSGSGPCTLSFMNGTYTPGFYSLSVPPSMPLDIIFLPGLTSTLQLYVDSPSLAYIHGSGSLIYNSDLAFATDSPATLDRLQLYNSTIQLSAMVPPTTKNCTGRNSEFHFYSHITHEHFEVVDCTQYFNSADFFDSYVEGYYHPAIIPPDNSGSFPPRYTSTDNKRISHQSALHSSSGGMRTGSMVAYKPTKRSALLQNALVISYIRTTLNLTYARLDTATARFENSTIINTYMEFLDISFTRTTVTQYLPNMYIYASPPLVMQDFSFANPNRHPSSHLRINGNGQLTVAPLKNVTISDLVLQNGATLKLGDVEITQSISAPASSSPARIQPITPDTSWNLHSIDVSNVVMTFTGLNHLIYTPSNASKGISMIDPSTPLSPLPQRISIHWHSGLPLPTYLQVYPVTNFSRDGSNHLITLSDPFSPYPLAASFTRPNSTLMTFQSFYNPQLPPNCFDPPPGFACSPTGTLYASTSVNQTSITISGQSGNIVIVGNLTIESGVTLAGTGTTLTVLGCATIGDGITLDVDPEKALPKGPVTIITQYEYCDGPALNTVPLKVKSSKESCKRVSVKTDPASSPSHLSAIFVVDKSRCNVKWIIIGAVVGAALIIAVVIAFVLGSYLHTRAQHKRVKMT